MNCERANDLFPDYLTDSLGETCERELQLHLAGCAACREEADRLRATWKLLGLLPGERPTPALRARFYDALEAYHEGFEARRARSIGHWLERLWPRRPLFQFALAMSCAVAGVALGRFAPAPKHEPVEVSQLRSELASMRQLVTLSLLQQESAADRLRGVTYSYRVQPNDAEVLAALLQTVNHDPNVNVRLSSVDALRAFASSALVRKGMVQSLAKQDSPMVQIALIDALTDLRDADAAPSFEKLAADSTVNDSVRQRARWALSRIGAGGEKQ